MLHTCTGQMQGKQARDVIFKGHTSRAAAAECSTDKSVIRSRERHLRSVAYLLQLGAHCKSCPRLQAPEKAQVPEHLMSQQMARHHLHTKIGTYHCGQALCFLRALCISWQLHWQAHSPSNIARADKADSGTVVQLICISTTAQGLAMKEHVWQLTLSRGHAMLFRLWRPQRRLHSLFSVGLGRGSLCLFSRGTAQDRGSRGSLERACSITSTAASQVAFTGAR